MSPEEQREVVQSFLEDFDCVIKQRDMAVYGKKLEVIGVKVSSLLYACLRVAEELEFNNGDVYCRGYLVKVEPGWDGIQYTYEVMTMEEE